MHRLLIGLIVLLPLVPAKPGWAGDSLPGQWIIQSYQYCMEDAQPQSNELECGSNGTDQTITEVFRAQSDSSGTFTFSSETTYLQREVGGQPAPACNEESMYLNSGNERIGDYLTITSDGHPFTWWCQITSHGSGMVKIGYTGMPEFWVAKETATFRSSEGEVEVVAEPRNVLEELGEQTIYPYDLGYPAAPGEYGMETLIEWQGISHVLLPPHYASHLTVEHQA